jgi:hypothetical protein
VDIVREKLIKTRKNECIIVDADDFEYLNQWLWRISDTGYAVRTIEKPKKHTIKLHRLLLSFPEDKEVDHINGNKLDNRKSNLRLVTRSQNGANKGKRKDGKSIYKGVGWHKQRQKYRARIVFNKQEIHLGLFDNEIEAAKAYNEAAKFYFGEYARLNEI